MATFLLIAGAWHGAWCWERVVPLLEAGGHRVRPLELLGTGEDKTPPGEVTLAAWTDQVVEAIEAEPEPVILVGHSRGGIVISEAAERVPDRIARLVYVAAVLLESGESIAAEAGTQLRDAQGGILQNHPDGTSTLNPSTLAAVFYNATPAPWVERAAQRLRPEPMVVFNTAVRLTPGRYGRVPRAYVETAQDRTMSLARQRQMQARLPCAPVLHLDCDHSPFFSMPAELAEALASLAGARASGSFSKKEIGCPN